MLSHIVTTPTPSSKPALDAKPQLDRRGNQDHYFTNLFALDWVLMNLSLFICLGLHYPLTSWLTGPPEAIVTFVAIANAIWVIIAMVSDRYWISGGRKKSSSLHSFIVTIVLFFGILSLIYYQFFFAQIQFHFLLPSFILFTSLAVLLHYTLRSQIGSSAALFKYAIIGGNHKHARNLSNMIKETYGKRTLYLGQFGDEDQAQLVRLGDYEAIPAYLSDAAVDKLFYIDGSLSSRRLKKVLQESRNNLVDFEVVPQAIDSFNQGVQVGALGQVPTFTREQEPLRHARNRFFKRVFDIVFSLSIILLIFPWLFPIIILLIKLSSPGPIFFRQKRTGYWNRSFDLIKFRTMVTNEKANKQQAVAGDSRVTKVGKFLRKTSLDELPQFINVLLGDMSVVGPRPHMLEHTKEYSKMINWYLIRHEVKPGITGWAQVNGWRGPTKRLQDMLKRVEYDVYYIEHWSFWLDIKCILKTIYCVFGRDPNAL